MEDNILQPQQLDVVQQEMQATVEAEKLSEELLASVVVTPAWQEVLDLLEKKSSDKSICERLRPLVTDASVTDAQFGSMARSLFMAQKDVNETVEKVVETVKAHEK